ncbi:MULTISPECIES: bacillithiol biosynthesis deacetylase BshB2 [Bacillales]|uniref:bacillithiol biosynthesis deacetylase BshB2 n=1 Tax=Bacillales TaxID=1385 RepID=UPI001883839C|nr:MULTISPECIES: bacillithiol biosynthesis deacetylase BshB2 [Bacillaceae]MBF0708701.1 bacillithiol biosynthesis deacetylase BshB2 [Pseudalkalibacillus hwajinpoensis]MDO6655888.1 bacillithiol biosynthesis deacetylase BshB2 [Anaerobacillus sp. 1_MG-2023]WLR59982.1 bacillithiol biosynthesis deacetylase BshB2 [Pseudalkalibacillus hwajinpoensis]
MEKQVLVVFPHPDDEAFGTAGLITKFVNEGVPVTYACATLGEMGRNMGNPFFATRETLPEVRKKELQDACNAMGVKDLRMLGFRDKTLEFEDPELLVSTIGELVDELNPSLIITFYPEYGIHPDHDACSAAVIETLKRIPKEKRPTVYALPITPDREVVLGKPDKVFDVTDVLETKIKTIEAHRSQTEAMVARLEDGSMDPNSEMMSFIKQESFWIYPFDE